MQAINLIKNLVILVFLFSLVACGGDSDGGSGSGGNTLVANADSVTTLENVAVIIDVLSNDTVTSTASITLSTENTATKGTVELINNNSSLRYTPDAGVSDTTDSFQYTITDDNGTSTPATVTVTISAAAAPVPAAVNDSATTSPGTLVTVNVLANDTVTGVASITLSMENTATKGTIELINNNSSLRYTPDAGVSDTTDSFQYTVTDDNGTSMLATVEITISAATGSVTIISDATFFDTANANNWSVNSNLQTSNKMHGDRDFLIDQIPVDLVGQEWLSTANESKSFNGNLAQFTVTVSAEVFVLHGNAITNKPDWLSAWTETNITLTNNEPNTYTAFSRTFTAGSTVILGENGGTGQGMYIVVVTGGVNLDPVANADTASTSAANTVTINVTDNDSRLGGTNYTLDISKNADNGSAQKIDNDNILYDPDDSFDGTDSFEYTITTSGGQSSTAIVTVVVTKTGAAIPLAINDVANTVQNTAIIINVVANDTGLEDTPYIITINAATDAENGTTSIDGDNIEYTPDSGFAGMDSFEYMITDTDGESDTATVNINVNAIPVANSDNAVTLQNTTITIDVLANDSGLNDAPLVLSVASPTIVGSTTEISDLEILYTPANDFVGEDDFNYTVTDKDGDSAVTNVAVTVNCVDCALNTAVTLSWNVKPEADVVSSYEIYFAKSTTDTTNATELLQTLAVSSSGFDAGNPAVTFDAWDDLQLNKGDNLCFRLKARNAAGASGFSNGICGQIPL